MASPVSLIERAHEMYRDGRYEEALGYYTEALSMAVTKSQKIALHSNRAACFLKLHDFKLAAQECTSVLELDHKHTGALMLRAQTLVTLKEYQSALFDVNRLIDLNPSSQVYQNLHARLKTQLSLAPIPESEVEVEEEEIDKDEPFIRNNCASMVIEEKESIQTASKYPIQPDKTQHDGKGIVTEKEGNKESIDQHPKKCHTLPEPKMHSKLDYSRWDQIGTDSSDDEDDEDSQPQYQFRVKTVNVRHVK
uniref:Uncharacterized protein n=1 Tax=Kalanchoe fedtschenkoi TaxID=63787 RepID=A0A7N0U9M9_KALFE